MKKYIIFSLVFSFFSLHLMATPSLPSNDNFTFEFSRKVNLTAGTLILLEFAEQIESNQMTVGQLVKFKVSTDVIVDGKTLIRTGALAYGRVKSVSATTYNSPEEIHFELNTVQAVDGQQITLNGAEQIIKGDFAGQGSIAKVGTTITATVMNDTEVKTK